MNAATIQQVRPAGARHEALLLVVAALCVVTVLGRYVRSHGLHEVQEPLAAWQVSAFETLQGADQAVYNALFTAKDDIPYLYDDINMMNAPGQKFRWPAVKDLQEALLPPFHQDTSWQQNGSLQWSLYEPLAEGEMQGTVMYLGTGGTQPAQGSFLLVIGHVHAGFRNTNALFIWWHPQNQVAMPRSGFRDGLIRQGWREVVPLSGAQESSRIFGRDAGDDSAAADQAEAEKAIQGLFGEP